jgi:hypothetical protein
MSMPSDIGRTARCFASVGVALAYVLVGHSSTGDASPNAMAPLGVDVSTGFYSTAAVDNFQSLVGVPVGIVQNFISWEYTTSNTFNQFPTSHVLAIIADGHTPEITWDPTITGDPSVNQPSMSLAAIADGDYDSYIDTFAESAASVKAPILIRFANEMNLPSTSYSETNSGNQPGDFVRAWRHVWELFQQAGATNVSWIWSPNIVPAGDDSLAELYPGDAYVNWVGVDGYSYPQEGCETAEQEFTPFLDEIEKFTSKPVMLAETGIAAACANKPALITSLFSWLQTQPEIQSLTWWERSDSDENYLVESSAASETAFQVGVASWESWLSTASGDPTVTSGSSTTQTTPGGTVGPVTGTTTAATVPVPVTVLRTVTAAAVAADLRRWLYPVTSLSGKPGRLSAIKRAAGYEATFAATIPGTVKVRWTVSEKISRSHRTKTVTVAGATAKTEVPYTVIVIRLTKAGRAFLRTLRRGRVRATATFTYAYGASARSYTRSRILTLAG